MYDMYPWNDRSADPGGRPPSPGGTHPPGPPLETPRAREGFPPSRTPPAATHAVQVALDRRDNGGDAEAGRPATMPATPPATLPTTGRTRQ